MALRLELSPDIKYVRVAHSPFLVHLRTGHCFVLNGLGAEVCDRIAAGSDTEAIIAHLSCHYDVNAEQLRTDVESFVRTLLDEALARVQP